MGPKLREKLTQSVVQLSEGGGPIKIMQDPVKVALDPNPYKTVILAFPPEMRYEIIKTVAPIILDRNLWLMDEDFKKQVERSGIPIDLGHGECFEW